MNVLASYAADGTEIGGWVYGPRAASWDRRLEVEKIVGPGPNARRTETSVTIDDKGWRDYFDSGTPSGGTATGSWHSHPNGVGHPSGQDLRSAAQQFRDLDETTYAPFWLEIVVTAGRRANPSDPFGPDVAEWIGSRPAIHAYILRRTNAGIVAERAQMEA